MGSAAAREVRLLLDTPPELKEAEQKQLTSKAVVVLQVYRAVSASGTHPCTPLFGTGWDQACIDTSGEHLGFDMKEYGHRESPQVRWHRHHVGHSDEHSDVSTA
eukprot:TRINITY_DN6328_c0_g1_i1.p2 TRINITY_DN6328_c0_g1~~TRINITY_DN6328_c0_g1_i1.p2  ORF type:complete len:113 (+),score=43.71 TRINITY_DN6328_c0_g1_i1:29-340(+)